MPYVNIKITREGATPEQKATLIKGVTELLRDTLGKNPATTVVVVEEVDTDNWGIGGETVTVRRKRDSAGGVERREGFTDSSPSTGERRENSSSPRPPAPRA
jgi:4-oxalocrotonate tautomerase